MEATAFLGGAAMICCMLITAKTVASARNRRVLYTMLAAPLVCFVSALVVLALPFDLGSVDLASVLRLAAFALVAVVVAVGIGATLRSNARFRVRRGTYATWQRYQRV